MNAKTATFSPEYIANIQQMIYSISLADQSASISYPFIPFIDTSKRVAVVGLETRKWIGRLSSAFEKNLDMAGIMDASINAYCSYDASLKKRGQFAALMKQVESIFCEKPLWLNFFAFDFEDRTINRLKNDSLKNSLMDRSVIKLTEELKIAKPEVIIFVGNYYNRFDLVANKLTIKRDRIKIGKYFSEEWDNCLITRIPHPAARSVINKSEIISENLNTIFNRWNEPSYSTTLEGTAR